MAYTEDFTGSEGELTGNWTTHADFVGVRKNGSGEGYNTTSAGDAISIYTGGAQLTDQYAQVVLKDSSSDNASLILRATGTTGTDQFYTVYYISSGSVYVGIYDGASWNTIGSPISQWFSNDDVLRAELVGYTFTIYKNGTPLGSITDTGEYIASGYVGVGIYDNVITIDDWEASGLASSSQSAYLEATVPRITQYALEVLAQPDTVEPRATQYALEVLAQPDTVEPRVTQYVLEVLIKPTKSNTPAYMFGAGSANSSVPVFTDARIFPIIDDFSGTEGEDWSDNYWKTWS